MRWRVLFVAAFAWLVLGSIGLHVAELADSSPWLWVALGPASVEFLACRCVDRVFVDAAHGPPFLTIPGIVLVYLLPASLAMWFALYKLHQRSWLYALAALPLIAIVAGVFPWMYQLSGPAKGSVGHGDYLVEPPRPCGPGAPANTHRIFYKGRVITKVAGEVAFSPLNPSRILYEAEPWCTDEAVATFYFDGTRAPAKVFEALKGAQLFWSPDDRFLVSSRYSLALVDLQAGQSSDLSDFFVGQGVSDSHPEFRGWSPDGKALTIANVASYSRETGSDFRATDIVSLDPVTLQDSYVSTISGTDDTSVYRRPERQRTTDLGGGVTLVETLRGFPGEREEIVIRQTVLRDGAEVWESRYTTFDMSLSPDHRHLAAWNNVNRLAPWRVYDLSTGRFVAVHSSYAGGSAAIRFGRWTDDSRAIAAAVDAFERATDASGHVKPDARLVPYRQTFRIDPSTGAIAEESHCQQPDTTGADNTKVSWDTTPCAGTFRD